MIYVRAKGQYGPYINIYRRRRSGSLSGANKMRSTCNSLRLFVQLRTPDCIVSYQWLKSFSWLYRNRLCPTLKFGAASTMAVYDTGLNSMQVDPTSEQNLWSLRLQLANLNLSNGSAASSTGGGLDAFKKASWKPRSFSAPVRPVTGGNREGGMTPDSEPTPRKLPKVFWCKHYETSSMQSTVEVEHAE